MTNPLKDQPRDQHHTDRSNDPADHPVLKMPVQIHQDLQQVNRRTDKQGGLEHHRLRGVKGAAGTLNVVDGLKRPVHRVVGQQEDRNQTDDQRKEIEPPFRPVFSHQVEDGDSDMAVLEGDVAGGDHPGVAHNTITTSNAHWVGALKA